MGQEEGASSCAWQSRPLEVVPRSTQSPDPRREGEEAHKRIMGERHQFEVPVPPPEAPPAARTFYTRRSGIAQRGHMPGCKGCTTLRMSLTASLTYYKSKTQYLFEENREFQNADVGPRLVLDDRGNYGGVSAFGLQICWTGTNEKFP